MPPLRHRIFFLAVPAVLFASLAVAATPGPAREFTVGELRILHPNVPPTPPGVSSAAGYLVIVNKGDEPDRLLGGDAPSFASGIEIHRTTLEDDVSRMRSLDEGLEIPAGATTRLDPGETHLMFTGLSETLSDGETRPATLVFEHGGPVDIEFAIERPAPTGKPVGEMDHGETGNGGMNHGEKGHGEMNCGEMNHGKMNHGKMNHGKMNHGEVGHGGMDHGEMNCGEMDHGEMTGKATSEPGADTEGAATLDVK